MCIVRCFTCCSNIYVGEEMIGRGSVQNNKISNEIEYLHVVCVCVNVVFVRCQFACNVML
jgi:hypothetical protein